MEYEFNIYGDSWVEINKFVNSLQYFFEILELNKENNDELYLNAHTEKFVLEERDYFYEFKILSKNNEILLIKLNTFGSYKYNLIKELEIQQILNFGGKCDLLFFQNHKLVLGIEDTDTSNIGNSAFQRMDRIAYFIEKNVYFLYSNYLYSYDRSKSQKTKRNPNYSQYLFFKKFKKINIYSKYDQEKEPDIRDKSILGAFFYFFLIKNSKKEFYDFLKKSRNFKKQENEISVTKNYESYKNDINVNNHIWLKDDDVKRISTFLNADLNKKIQLLNSKDYKCWKPSFKGNPDFLKSIANISKVIQEKEKQHVAFTQSVLFLKFLDDMQASEKIQSSDKNIIKDKILKFKKDNSLTENFPILIMPIMLVQEESKKILKVDPATGELTYNYYLFIKQKNKEATRQIMMLTIIYSDNVGMDDFHKSNKLISRIKMCSDIICISNKNYYLKPIEKCYLTNNNNFGEDDLDFFFEKYMIQNGWKLLYMSAPSSSWNFLKIEKQKQFISKDKKRPDYIFQKNNTFIIGESKSKLCDLVSEEKRKKHMEAFSSFKQEILKSKQKDDSTSIFSVYEINICFSNDKEILDFADNINFNILYIDKNEIIDNDGNFLFKKAKNFDNNININ